MGNLMVLPGTGGLAISEAMAHGLPVICSIGDGVESDLIDVGVNGYIVEPGDEKQLADTIADIFSNPHRVSEMGQASLNIIRNRANIDTYMCEMLSAISYAAGTNGK